MTRTILLVALTLGQLYLWYDYYLRHRKWVVLPVAGDTPSTLRFDCETLPPYQFHGVPYCWDSKAHDWSQRFGEEKHSKADPKALREF